MAHNEPDTDLHERIATLEAKVNGGPGQSLICKFHKEALEELKATVEKLSQVVGEVSKRQAVISAGLAVIVFIAPFAKEIIMHLINRKP